MEKTHSIPKSVWRFLLSAAVFFAATMPFRYWFSLTNVTEIRPAAALPPFFGMVFGVPGILGCAVSNLAADLLSGYSPAMSLASFPVQCLMGLLPWVLGSVVVLLKREKKCGKMEEKTGEKENGDNNSQVPILWK